MIKLLRYIHIEGDEAFRPGDNFIVKTHKKLSLLEYVTKSQPSYEMYECNCDTTYFLVMYASRLKYVLYGRVL